MRLLTRLHEWSADHFSFVQYPNVRRARYAPQRPALSVGERFAFGAVGMLLVFGSMAVIAGALFVLWALWSS